MQNQELTFDKQYFAVTEFVKPNFREVFVDCGAYVGDTLEQFLFVRSGIFQKAYEFEPVEKNFCAMRNRVKRLKHEWPISDEQIMLIQAGVGDKTYQTELMRYSAENVAANNGALSGESAHGDISVISLDQYFTEQSITFLKADIEGYEWKMLHGAEQVIRRDRPKLAICIYHAPFDMYRIALWIKSICPDYRFEIRQHSCDIWDTVLYAYI